MSQKQYNTFYFKKDGDEWNVLTVSNIYSGSDAVSGHNKYLALLLGLAPSLFLVGRAAPKIETKNNS